MKRKYPRAYKHGDISKLFEDVYWVHGSIKMAPTMYMNRNMVIIREKANLFLVNPIRLNEKGENNLKELGKIKAIIRLGDFHGLDDQYYIDTFDCEFWCQEGQTTYPSPESCHTITADIKPPFNNADFFIFSKALYPEAAIHLKDKKLLITTDSIQNWTDWQHMSPMGKLLLWLMGFRLGLFIGKPWLKRVSPKGDTLAADFKRLLLLDFEHLIAAHGKPLFGGASQKVHDIVAAEFN